MLPEKFIFLKQTSQTKFESLPIPNLHIPEKFVKKGFRGLRQVLGKTMLAATIMDKIFEKNFRFYVK